MPFTHYWLLEDRVVFIQFNEEITLSDVAEVSETHESWLATHKSSNVVHYIIDLRQVKNYPRNILEIKRSLHTKMADTDWILFVSHDYFLNHIGRVLARLLNYRFKQCASVHNAYRFLQKTEGIPPPNDGIDNLDDTTSRH